MKSPSYLLLFSLLLLMSTNSEAKSNTDELKPRIVIMSDIGDCNVEPDDMESAIRLFSYADQFEIEAFMTTVGWNCDPYPQEWGKVLEQVIDAYDVERCRGRPPLFLLVVPTWSRHLPYKTRYHGQYRIMPQIPSAPNCERGKNTPHLWGAWRRTLPFSLLPKSHLGSEMIISKRGDTCDDLFHLSIDGVPSFHFPFFLSSIG